MRQPQNRILSWAIPLDSWLVHQGTLYLALRKIRKKKFIYYVLGTYLENCLWWRRSIEVKRRYLHLIISLETVLRESS